MKCRIKISSTNFIEVGECFDGPGNLDISLCGESNIKDYFLLLERSYPDILSTKYQKMQTLLGCSDESILTMLPKKYLSTSIDNTLSAIKDIADSKEDRAYLTTYLQIKEFLGSLVRASVNVEKINKFILKKGVAIIPGFQGISKDGEITTIGRGGSDATAVAIAKMFNTEECEIYTDVEGVYSTDPRYFPKAKKINKISYEEMLEMSSLGAKIMQSSAVQTAMMYD